MSAYLARLSPPQDWPLYGQLTALCAIILLVVLCLSYLHTRSMLTQLADIRAERQLHYVLAQWRMRQLYSLMLVMLLCAGFIGLAMRLKPPPAPAPSPAATAEITCPAPSPPISEDVKARAVVALFPEAPPAADGAASLEAIKSRYENTLVSVHILRRCDRLTADEQATIESSLKDSLAQEQHLRPEVDISLLAQQIMDAARGSHDLFYYRTPCSAPELDLAEQQLASFALQYQSLKKNPPPQQEGQKDPATPAETPSNR